LRRCHSEDILVGPLVKHARGVRRKRGEVLLRIVDFAHTTTGHDYLPPSPGATTKDGGQITSGKGYQAEVDPETGLLYSRFPPHHPNEPDLGFLFGLKNLALTLEEIWNDERARQRSNPRQPSDSLGALPTYGKDIFDTIYASTGYPGDIDPGMIST